MRNHVLDYLNDIVKVKPDKLAFANETEGMTFLEVYEQSRSVGTYISDKDIYKKPIVVFMNKHPKEVTAFFGVITAGCFYVPIDEEMPAGSVSVHSENSLASTVTVQEAVLPPTDAVIIASPGRCAVTTP